MVHLGRIVVGAAASKNNTNTTGTPFNIPATTRAIWIRPSADGFYTSKPDGGTVAVPSSLAATVTDFPLVATFAFEEVLGASGGGGTTYTVAVYSTAGGNFDVYGVVG